MLTPPIAIHLLAALPALIVGAVQLALPKGTQLHRLTGRVWVALIVLAAVSSFWIRELDAAGGFSWIHLLSIWTLVSVTFAVYYIRRGNSRAHRGFMIGTYAGLCGAGAFALAPGRLLSEILFG